MGLVPNLEIIRFSTKSPDFYLQLNLQAPPPFPTHAVFGLQHAQ